MRERFETLVTRLESRLPKGVDFVASIDGESSDFVRFNRGRVRQAGSVEQNGMHIRLVSGLRHASAGFSLEGTVESDYARLDAAVDQLTELLPHLPEDPHLLLAEEVQNTEQISKNRLPATSDVVKQVVDGALSGEEELDLVGIYAGGEITQGLANSHGQRNWFRTYSCNLDWCLYHSEDKAVKCNLAGSTWDAQAFQDKLDSGRRQLEVLGRTPQKIEPGHYRVYLAPAAVAEVISMMSWGGFSHRCVENRTTPLLKLIDGERRMSPQVQIAEAPGAGFAPCFQGSGFVRPDRIPLIEKGEHAGSLVSPRSAKEHGIATNGASASEQPIALEMAPGSLPAGGLLEALGTGIWVSNLWYLNFSDQAAGRITGMTRFATFWVENGQIVAPLSVMRFDDTFYNCLGDHLEGLSHEAELKLSADTYFARSTQSARVPGALVNDFALTL